MPDSSSSSSDLSSSSSDLSNSSSDSSNSSSDLSNSSSDLSSSANASDSNVPQVEMEIENKKDKEKEKEKEEGTGTGEKEKDIREIGNTENLVKDDESDGTKGQEVSEDEKIRRAARLTPWVVKHKRNSFVLPLEHSIIMIKVENMKERNQPQTRSKNHKYVSNTEYLYGQVTEVKNIDSQSITVEGVYIERKMKVTEKMIRIDKLKYSLFGGSRNMWSVICTPQGSLLNNTIPSKKLDHIKKLSNDDTLPQRIVDTKAEPLAFEKMHHMIPIIDCKCQICKGSEDVHPNFGVMVICDICNKGWHTECAQNDGRPSIELEEDWICPECAESWNPEAIKKGLEDIKKRKIEEKANHKKRGKSQARNPIAKKQKLC